MQTTPPQQNERIATRPSPASPERVDVVTRVRPKEPTPGKIAHRLAAVGIRTVPTPDGGGYADCPLCDHFAGLIVEPGGSRWRLVCGCLPARGRYDSADLMAELAGRPK
jgi:hypothetical protein